MDSQVARTSISSPACWNSSSDRTTTSVGKYPFMQGSFYAMAAIWSRCSFPMRCRCGRNSRTRSSFKMGEDAMFNALHLAANEKARHVAPRDLDAVALPAARPRRDKRGGMGGLLRPLRRWCIGSSLGVTFTGASFTTPPLDEPPGTSPHSVSIGMQALSDSPWTHTARHVRGRT